MNVLTALLAVAVTAQPIANPEVLEPSVRNEVEHALAKAPKTTRFVKHTFAGKGSASERAIALVSSQKGDGRWLDGTNDVTFAAVAELRRFACGDGSFKVLMIGNSFSISNIRNMPQVCQSLGLDLEICSLYIGGCSLQRHWNNVVAATNATFAPYRVDWYRSGERLEDAPKALNIPAALASRRWDVVTIQQCSHESWQPATYHPYGDNLVKTVRQLAPQAEIVVQQTWSYTPWDRRFKRWNLDQNTMFGCLEAAYAEFAKGYGFRVIPMGAAVQAWRRQLPVRYTESSFGGDVCGSAEFVKGADGAYVTKGDVFHLNKRGEYFQSLVWTASLFGADVTACAYRPDFVPESDAALMKSIANSLR